MCDACLCPNCRKAISLTEIQPFWLLDEKQRDYNKKGELRMKHLNDEDVKWFCDSCFKNPKVMTNYVKKSHGITDSKPIELSHYITLPSNDSNSYFRIMIWGDDRKS
jgi:hypothetical protein